MLNTDSRRRSAVGRISRDVGEARLRPFNLPPTTRIGQLLVPRLQVALAVIAALRTARRAVAVGFFLVARAGFVAAGALYQHAAALAIGNEPALAGRLERLFAARCVTLLSLGLIGFRLSLHRPVEIGAGEGCDLLAELLAQHAGFDFLDLPLGEFAELERAVGHA